MTAHAAVLHHPELTDNDYLRFRHLLYANTGIHLGEAKKTLVSSRLSRRLSERSVRSYSDYLHMLDHEEHADELQVAIDLLTTNETYFFREPNHFNFLKQLASNYSGNLSFRVWSAAASFGQEAFSIAMVLEECLGTRPWEVVGSDISTRVIETALAARYPIAQAEKIPAEYLARHCLRGVGSQDGVFAIDRELRKRVAFCYGNLVGDLPNVGQCDVIFLRNVMIYFDAEVKRKVIGRLYDSLKPGGYLLIGHSESLNGVTEALKMVSPSIFRKP